MRLSQDQITILAQIADAKTLSEAVALVPEDWNLTVMGRSGEGKNAGASIVPSGLHEDHMLVRLEGRGLLQGHASDRLSAMKGAVDFIFQRLAKDS